MTKSSAKRRERKLREKAFHEVKYNAPAQVMDTWVKKGPKAARKQQVAIALNKVRQAKRTK